MFILLTLRVQSLNTTIRTIVGIWWRFLDTMMEVFKYSTGKGHYQMKKLNCSTNLTKKRTKEVQ